MNDYLSADQRHLSRMQEAIKRYRSKQLNLRSLINSLEALLEALERMPDDFINPARQEWGKIEDAYAVSLDRGQNELTQEDDQYINAALFQLNKLIEKQLSVGGPTMNV